MSDDQDDEIVERTIEEVEKEHGEGSIMKLGEHQQNDDVDAIPTGAKTLDIATGVGGVPRGRVTEIYGPESSGKTTLALSVVAQAQKDGGNAAFIDVEHALDPDYAESIGVKTDELLVSQPDTGEEALEIAEKLIRSGGVDVVAIDSVAALVPEAEIEGEMGDAHVGLQARLMSQSMRKLSGAINKSDTACIFLNQIREKIGVMYGNPETTPGGRALKFYSSLRLDIRQTDVLKDGGEQQGIKVRVRCVKNKVAAPFRDAEFTILYGEGIDEIGSVIDVAMEEGIVERRGSWYYYGDDQLAQGSEKTKAYLKDNPDLLDEIVAKTDASLEPDEPEEGEGDADEGDADEETDDDSDSEAEDSDD